MSEALTKYDRMRANAVAYDFYKDLVDEQRLACLQRLVQDGAGINDGALLCLRIALLVDSSKLSFSCATARCILPKLASAVFGLTRLQVRRQRPRQSYRASIGVSAGQCRPARSVVSG